MLNQQALDKVHAFFEKHGDIEYQPIGVVLMQKALAARANEHFRRLPLERQRKIIEQAKDGMREELNKFLVEEGLMNEEYLIEDSEA